MKTYEDIRSAFRWEVPETFNFASDVVDAWAKDPAKLAPLWCDESGREERYSYARISEQSKTTVNGVEYWLTGDMVRQDEEGYLFYEGRADDIISSAGYRIGPMEVENALLEHPAVQESAAVGKPDAERGEIVKAFVVLKQGFEGSAQLAAELQGHVKQTTAAYKYPREIEFVAELPKNASGKLLRRLLRG